MPETDDASVASDRISWPYQLTVGFIRKFMCAVYGSILVIALVLYGITQEKIMTMPYGPSNKWFFQFSHVHPEDIGKPGWDIFADSPFLVLITRLVGMIAALLLTIMSREHLQNQAPFWKYALIATAGSFTSILQFESLKYVEFNVQMLCKCCKPLPVLCYGHCIHGKNYVLVDWLCLGMTALAAVIFLLCGDIDSHYIREHSSLYGVVLLFGSMIFDGFVSFYQEKLNKMHETSKYNQMLWTNLTSAVVCFLWCLISGRLPEAIRFGCKHTIFFGDATFIGGLAIIGQWCIHSIVNEFGPAIFLAFLNVRLAISVALSDIIYGHRNTIAQLLALFIVAGALVFRSCVTASAWLAQESELEEKLPLVSKRVVDKKETEKKNAGKSAKKNAGRCFSSLPCGECMLPE
mmetsp:Transcript_110243/g.235420  ORF Transcript_110243/g.235420 Transcript_110243/m.235420 type:complete len:406 (-) Transcript_110243:29-1246(-)